MTKGTIHVCTECRHPSYSKHRQGKAGGFALIDEIGRALTREELDRDFRLDAVKCLGNCKKRCRISFGAPKKWSWLIGGISPDDDLADLMRVLRKWDRAETGLIAKEERGKWLLRHSLGRLPPYS